MSNSIRFFVCYQEDKKKQKKKWAEIPAAREEKMRNDISANRWKICESEKDFLTKSTENEKTEFLEQLVHELSHELCSSYQIVVLQLTLNFLRNTTFESVEYRESLIKVIQENMKWFF